MAIEMKHVIETHLIKTKVILYKSFISLSLRAVQRVISIKQEQRVEVMKVGVAYVYQGI